ncbi:HigA family addiction module antitoxin [Methylobacterium sp. A54F]
MARKAAVRRLTPAPTHPGRILREEVLAALEMSIPDAAAYLGISRQALHRFVMERSGVTPNMALRLGKFCGNGPEAWLNLQSLYDLWRLRPEIAQELERIPTMHPSGRACR